MSEKRNNKGNNQTKKRPVDIVVESDYGGLISKLRLVSNKQIGLWKALVIMAFVAGFVAAIVWAVSYPSDQIDLSSTRAATGDIVNKAYVTYEDSSGNSYTGESNEVVVQVIVSGNVLEVSLNLECSSNNNVPVVVNILNQGTESIVLALSGNTNSSGVFTGNVGSLSGTYDVRVRVNKYLTKKVVNIQIPSNTRVSFGNILAGDLQVNNLVNTGDYSIMSQTWFTASADADINKDGIVNTTDFACLSANWYEQGT